MGTLLEQWSLSIEDVASAAPKTVIFTPVHSSIKMRKIRYKRVSICREQQCELHLWQMCVTWIEIETEALFIFVASK